MATTVWVVRHGQRQDTVDPDWDHHADRVHDPGLTDHGKWQAWRVGRRFAAAGIDFSAVYSSPFLRTVQTADEIARETDHEVRLEPGLGEHRNPEWFDAEPETLPVETLDERFDPVRLDHDPLVHPAFPEDHDEAERRAGETARRIADARSGDVLLVGHGLTVGGVTRGLVGSTEGVAAPLCGITRIEWRGDGWDLAVSGDTGHLEAW